MELFTDDDSLAITNLHLTDFIKDGAIETNHFRIINLVEVQVVQNALLLFQQNLL